MKKIGLFLLLAALTAAPAFAQTPRVEASFNFGWTFADGVEGQAFLAGDGNIYDRVDPKDSVNWGFQVGALVSDNMEAGFIFSRQATKLEAGGTATREIGDQAIATYHGYFAYNFGEADATVRPYMLFGLGATNYSDVDFSTANRSGTISGQTQFSGTLGAGVKVFPQPRLGFRGGIRWTPTYIKSDAVGWWCDPYWGCYLVGDAQYANQWEITGGVTVRF